MFYLHQHHEQRKKEFALTYFGPVFIVFLAFFSLTVWLALDARASQRQNETELLTRSMSDAQSAIQLRFTTYENILTAGVGLFNASDTVGSKEWAAFVDTFDLINRYPGILGVGYATIVPNANLDTFTQKIRSQEQPTFEVKPAGSRPSYVVVTYLEPATETNNQALGYAMYSQPARKAAMDLARDSGTIALSDAVFSSVPGQTVSKPPQPGFLLYVPLYARGTNPTTPQQRQQDIIGYVYAPFRSQELLGNLFKQTNSSFGFELFDNSSTEIGPLYKSPSFESINKNSDKQTMSQSFDIYNKQWQMVAVASPSILSTNTRQRSLMIFITGTFVSIFIASFIYLLLMNRMQGIANKEEHEVGTAKDELLALASHQLRTPATGVKQYIGLLKDGYAGEMTAEQKLYVDKAYASNERQLNTINEMLFVAQSDAGKVRLRKTKFNVVELVRDTINELTPAMRIKDQQIVTSIPKKPMYIYADYQYMRMAVENILNNATKYTENGGIVTVMVHRKRTVVNITIQDNGVGVDKKDFSLLFQKFSRIPNQLTNKVSGSGIGLYLAKIIIESHKGEVEFRSEAGVGSIVTLTIPVGRKAKA